MNENRQKENLAFKAGFWYVISNIIVKAISIITTPIFTRLMSTVEYGTVQTFTSWQTLLLPLFTLNLTYSIGRAKLDFPDELDNYIGSMQALSGITSFTFSLIVIAFIKTFSSFFALTAGETILLILYLFFGVAPLLHQSGYRFRYKYKQNIAIALYTALSTTILSLLLVLLVRGNKANLRIIGIVLPTVILSLFFWGKIFKSRTINIKREHCKYGLVISLPLILHTICMHILSQADRIFITKIWGQSDTAYYSLAYSYGMMLNIFITAAHDGWLPWFHDAYFAERFEEIKEKVKPMVVFACYVGLACVALAPEIILVLGGAKYVKSVSCVPPIALGVVCQFIYTQYVSIELHLKKTIYVSAGTIMAAFINIGLNTICIPRYGFEVAAYTTLVSYFVLMVVHFLITSKVLRVRLYDDWFMFGAFLVTALISILLVRTYNNSIVRYGMICAGFVSFLYYFREFLRSWIKKHIKKTVASETIEQQIEKAQAKID